MKLSIFLAGIRAPNWLALYDSIPNTTGLSKKEYELVIVSPYDLPPELQSIDNVRLVKDWGSPTRCYQLGLLHSRGEYVVFAADDGVFSPTMALDKAFDARPNHYKGIVTFKYHEGNVTETSQAVQLSDEYWKLGHHKLFTDIPSIPVDYFLVMLALIRRDYFMEIGGWDCRIEQPGVACPDLSIRLQNDGAKIVLGEKFMDLTHITGKTSDHGPIVQSFKKNDRPLFNKMYRRNATDRSKIDFNNWKQVPDIWGRRFPNGKV